MRRMKLLIVGASGFLGRNVLQVAEASGWDLVGTYHRSKTFPEVAKKHGCEAVRLDLLAPSRTWDADVCLYLAGNPDHRASVLSPPDDLRLNAEALARFLDGFHGGLVLMSSAAVYDGHSGEVTPSAKLDPRWPYAISKFTAEQYVRWSLSIGRLRWATILRLYYAYGPHDHVTRLVPRVLKAVEMRRREFVVTAPPGSLLDPLFAEDVARAALAAARGQAKGETLDLCGGHPREVHEIVREAVQILGVPMDVVEKPREDERPVRFHSNPKTCRDRLGLGAFTTLPQGIQRTATWMASEIQAGRAVDFKET